ncbi:MAG: RNA polymerase sigma factor [Planctomycetota bacterium]|jgi:RNA polymerase sigma-70 factor (ECF subfamily)
MQASQPAKLERTLRKNALAGDEAAWRILYERAYAPLYIYVDRRTAHDRPETDEIVQECWLVAVRRLRSFDPDRGTFLAWLLGIAGNVVRNRRRSRARQAREKEAGALDTAGPARASAERTREVAEQIAVAMAALSNRYRAVLRAKYEQQLSVAEIAARWRESTKAIESLLTRARAAFRTVYKELGG